MLQQRAIYRQCLCAEIHETFLEQEQDIKEEHSTFHSHFVTHPLLSRKSSLATPHPLGRTKSLASYAALSSR